MDGQGVVAEYQLGDHRGGNKLATQVVVHSNTVVDGQRTVVLSRKFAAGLDLSRRNTFYVQKIQRP